MAGLWHRQGEPECRVEPSTLFERCDALHARLDAVLAENVGVGRIAGSSEKKGVDPGRLWGKR